MNLRKSLTPPLSGSYRYSYDRERKLTSILFPSGREVVHTYARGSLTGISTPEGVTGFSYSCGSVPGEVTRGAEKITYVYDGSLLTGDTRTGLINQRVAYGYNDDFRISRVSYAGLSPDLTYDADGLLTGAGTFAVTRNGQNGLPESVSDGTLMVSGSSTGTLSWRNSIMPSGASIPTATP